MIKARTRHRAAVLAALASVLQVLESFFPHPVPGVRLGLANMITIVALVHEGFGTAMEIAVIRTLISAFMLGTFMTPSFILSIISAIASTAAMGLMYFVFSKHEKPLLGITGISLAGAVTHNLTQITLIYFVFIKHAGILMLIPVLGISAVVTGWVNGMIASAICRKVDAGVEKRFRARGHAATGPMPVPSVTEVKGTGTSIPAEAKILFVTLLGISVVITDNAVFYLSAMIFLPLLGAALKADVSAMIKAVIRMRYFILFSLLIPVLFGGSGKVFFSAWIISITADGIRDGLTYALRIIILIFGSSLVTVTTTPDAIASGIKNLLLPLGRRAGTFGRTLADAWSDMPALWEACTGFSALAFRKKEGKDRSKLIDSIAGFVALLYLSYGHEKTGKKAG